LKNNLTVFDWQSAPAVHVGVCLANQWSLLAPVTSPTVLTCGLVFCTARLCVCTIMSLIRSFSLVQNLIHCCISNEDPTLF